MVQAGDPEGTGMGGPGYKFADETKGCLLYTSFITEEVFPDLDGKYTIFGQCDAHTQLLAASIARVVRDSNDKPTTPVVIEHVTIVREGQAMPPLPATPPAPTPTTTNNQQPASNN